MDSDGFYADLRGGSYLEPGAMVLLSRHKVEIEQLEQVLKFVFARLL